MTKFLMAAVAAMVLVAPAVYAQTNDTTAEINMETPDITARGENVDVYMQRVPNSTVRTTTTTYTTTTSRGSSQAAIIDGEVYRPYRTFTRVISKTPTVTTVNSATYSAPDEQISMEQEADLLIKKVESNPMAGEIVVIE